MFMVLFDRYVKYSKCISSTGFRVGRSGAGKRTKNKSQHYSNQPASPHIKKHTGEQQYSRSSSSNQFYHGPQCSSFRMSKYRRRLHSRWTDGFVDRGCERYQGEEVYVLVSIYTT